MYSIYRMHATRMYTGGMLHGWDRLQLQCFFICVFYFMIDFWLSPPDAKQQLTDQLRTGLSCSALPGFRCHPAPMQERCMAQSSPRRLARRHCNYWRLVKTKKLEQQSYPLPLQQKKQSQRERRQLCSPNNNTAASRPYAIESKRRNPLGGWAIFAFVLA